MRKIDRLLLQIREAQRLDDLTVANALIGQRNPPEGSWEVYVDLWDGKYGGKTERLTMECNSQEEALKAVKDVEEVHKPTGRKARIASGDAPIFLIDDIAWAE